MALSDRNEDPTALRSVNRNLAETRSRSGRFEEEKNVLPLQGTECRCHPSRGIFTVLSALSRVIQKKYTCYYAKIHTEVSETLIL